MTLIEIKVSETKGMSISGAQENQCFVYCLIKYGKSEFGKTILLPYVNSSTPVVWNQQFSKDLGKQCDPSDAIVVELRQSTSTFYGQQDEVLGTYTTTLEQVVRKSQRDKLFQMKPTSRATPIDRLKQQSTSSESTRSVLGTIPQNSAVVGQVKRSKVKKFGKFLKNKLRNNNHNHQQDIDENGRDGSMQPPSNNTLASFDSSVHTDPGQLKLSFYVVKDVPQEIPQVGEIVVRNMEPSSSVPTPPDSPAGVVHRINSLGNKLFRKTDSQLDMRPATPTESHSSSKSLAGGESPASFRSSTSMSSMPSSSNLSQKTAPSPTTQPTPVAFLYPEEGETFLLEHMVKHTERFGEGLGMENSARAYLAVLSDRLRWKSGNQTRTVELAIVVKMKQTDNSVRLWLHPGAHLVNAQPGANKILGSLETIANEVHEFQFADEFEATSWAAVVTDNVDLSKNVPQIEQGIHALDLKQVEKFVGNLMMDRDGDTGRQLGIDLLHKCLLKYQSMVVEASPDDESFSTDVNVVLQVTKTLIQSFPGSVLEFIKTDSKEQQFGKSLLHLAIEYTSGPSLEWSAAFHSQLYNLLLNADSSLLLLPDDDMNSPAHIAAKRFNMSAYEAVFMHQGCQPRRLHQCVNADNESVLACLMKSIAHQTHRPAKNEGPLNEALEAVTERLTELPNYGVTYGSPPRRSLMGHFGGAASSGEGQLRVADDSRKVDISGKLLKSEFAMACKYFTVHFVARIMECVPLELVEEYCKGQLDNVCARVQHNSQSNESVAVAGLVFFYAGLAKSPLDGPETKARPTLEEFFEDHEDQFRTFLMTDVEVGQIREAVAVHLKRQQSKSAASKSWATWITGKVETSSELSIRSKQAGTQLGIIYQSPGNFLSMASWLSSDYSWER